MFFEAVATADVSELLSSVAQLQMRLFELVDANGDGFIEPQEAHSVLGNNYLLLMSMAPTTMADSVKIDSQVRNALRSCMSTVL